MYYLFTYPGESMFIQLTFNGQSVDLSTEWTKMLPSVPGFMSAYDICDDWSTLDQWLSHDEFVLVTSSPNPITSLTHPELYL